MSRQAGSRIDVRRIGSAEPVRFAAEELARYLGAMCGGRVRVLPAARYAPGMAGVWVGEASAFGGTIAKQVQTSHPFDDRIRVVAGHGHAVVTGANARSVVFAAYRYLEELGCRWFRPGPFGERTPKVAAPLDVDVALDETPAARHRVICIEGSCSLEHVTSMVDYSAKRGFNAYFLQFRDSFTFFDRWYSQEAPDRGKARFTPAQAGRLCDRVKAEARRRGLLLHTVGHGWTCEPFGIAGNEWTPTAQPVPEAARKVFAEVKGKRELWGGIPLNTNLCYSQPGVRKIMGEAVADYAAAYPGEAVIHVWLADGSNNQCECRDCRKAQPSDWYVQILNAIDAQLTARRLATRIVFLAYVDLLWAPKRERIRNPGRFILMFAPITRSYSHAFLDGGSGKAERVGPYRRNALVFPSSPKANLTLLRGWKRDFPGDCVDFDYHLWWDWRNDPGQLQLARVLHSDVCNLGKLGMNGFISCQNQRPLFPTGIWMEVMGRGLWDPTVPFDDIVDRYLNRLFGRGGTQVKSYLQTITLLFDPAFLRGEKKGSRTRRNAQARLKQVPKAVAWLRPFVREGLRIPDPVTREAWRLLDEHTRHVEMLARLRLAWLRGDAAALARERKTFEKAIQSRLPWLNPVLDTWTLLRGLPSKPFDAK